MVDDIPIEKLDDDSLYNLALSNVLKVLESLNSDERSAYYKSQYI